VVADAPVVGACVPERAGVRSCGAGHRSWRVGSLQ
jgi:hypothetical protein